MHDHIFIKGARENNLKNIDLEIPRDKLVVFTGVSGSGKSSLAFDTIYAEGQRRYVESLSSYARQFLGQMEKPDVDFIEGLSPAISIDQKTTSRNPRSTVGTVTEIYDYLRLLYARIGVPHCPECGREIMQQTVDQMVDQIMTLPDDTRMQILAPVVRSRKGEYLKVFDDARKSGFVRVRVDGSIYDLSEEIKLDKNKKHNIEVVVDRLVKKEGFSSRLTDSIETALSLAGGLVIVDLMEPGKELLFSQNYACEVCGISIEALTPRMFSFNNPFGACPECTGLGFIQNIDPDLVIPDKDLSIAEGAICGSNWGNVKNDSIARMYFQALAKKYGFKLTTPIRELSEAQLSAILYGTKGVPLELQYERENGYGVLKQPFEGVINNLERRYKETQSEAMKAEYEDYMSFRPCKACGGRRLNKAALAVLVGGLNINDLCSLPISRARDFLLTLQLSQKDTMIAKQIQRELDARLNFLISVGLEYLTLSRQAATLSGGEGQRIRLATQIGSSLMGVLYILDEPSIGLHQKDNRRLLDTLKQLRDLGNTLIVVEHDAETMLEADHIVDIGPGAGVNGGYVVAQGTVDDIMACKASLTGQYLSGIKEIPIPVARRKGSGKQLIIYGAAENNLKNITVSFPLGTLTCVTGVSGSGKSTLVNTILYKALASRLNRAKERPGKFSKITGMEYLDKIINIDQNPIGRTPRSNPATYMGLFNDIRTLFASTPEAKAKGYGPGRFSFNVRGGRCEACSGDGSIKIEMHFLPDIYVPCEVCGGKRYNRETLDVRYKGKNISEVLDMTAGEAQDFFSSLPKINTKIETLCQVGLGYVKLGQPSPMLSGGEAQRVKLATELCRRSTGSTIYVLDEPTTGLHVDDVSKLIVMLGKLVDAGNTVIVIEHNLDVIKTADYVLDLGPDGGDAGGNIMVCGTPEQIAACPDSYTGQYLKKLLKA